MNNFYKRKRVIEDDLFGLASIQKSCYITDTSTKRCTTHEWLIKRSSGLPKRLQSVIFVPINMVLIDAVQHDVGLNPFMELYIAYRKIRLHGFGVIDTWLLSLEMKTAPTLEEWISHRINMASIFYERVGGNDGRALGHRAAPPYGEWTHHMCRYIANDARQEAYAWIRTDNSTNRNNSVQLV